MQLPYKTLSLFISSMLLAISAHSATIINEANNKAVGNVHWHKYADINPQEAPNKTIPNNASSVFFLRPLDQDKLQTSANIAINDRFQVSLQPGNYSQAYSCSGVNQISADITGNKNNDLSKNAITFNLEPQTTYYFDVDVDDNGIASIKHITKDSASNALRNMHYQTHQITRVVANCPPVQAPTTPPPAAIIPPIIKKETIALNVLFDTDKSIIKPIYYDEIQRVADYMQKHPNSTVTIEGHTDNRASNSYNLALSQRRVDAVKKILIEHFKLAPDRLNSVGYGETRPIASNDTAEGRQQNRRVVAVFENN